MHVHRQRFTSDNKNNLAVIGALLTFMLLITVVAGMLLQKKKVVSPVPDSNTVKIIFVTPTPDLKSAESTESGELEDEESIKEKSSQKSDSEE